SGVLENLVPNSLFRLSELSARYRSCRSDSNPTNFRFGRIHPDILPDGDAFGADSYLEKSVISISARRRSAFSRACASRIRSLLLRRAGKNSGSSGIVGLSTTVLPA